VFAGYARNPIAVLLLGKRGLIPITDLANEMSQLISMLKEKKDDIKRQRIQQGIEEKFSKLTSKELPSR
jgi:hypothetical protein